MRFVYGLVMVLAIGLPGPAPCRAASMHDFTDQCTLCHQPASDPAELVFRDAVDRLCGECHTLEEGDHHPSLVTTGMSLPGPFWLDEEDRLNCATCHDPHPEEGSAHAHLLRIEAVDATFCLECHAEPVSGEGDHVGVALIAHSKRRTPPIDPADDPGRLSRDCISCHDGSGGPHASFCLHLQKERGGCGGHIIGLDYAEAASGDRELTPPENLSPRISLYEGKVGCLSCHNIYSDLPVLLTVSMNGSALCLACHKK